MSITEIKHNENKLETLDKDVLVKYVKQLLILEKRQDSKIMSLQTEIKYYTRHFKKVRDLIDKTIKSKNRNKNSAGVWGEKDNGRLY